MSALKTELKATLALTLAVFKIDHDRAHKRSARPNPGYRQIEF